MNKLVNRMVDGYLKFDNSEESFMAVVVEEVMDKGKFKIISVAHYYEQNGDLMVDPEMMFIYFKDKNIYISFYFKQDGILCTEQESIIIENNEITGIKTKLQAEHTAFANIWLQNIKIQQHI